MNKIPFYLVTGFLGSGKITLLKRIINDHADSMKLAVIQNEFAPASVDGTDLRQTHKPFEMLEINKGSVFCVCLLSGFIKSLSVFIDSYTPDAVFLEARHEPNERFYQPVRQHRGSCSVYIWNL